MNSYFQNANSKSDPITWQSGLIKLEITSFLMIQKRFSLLYNNLKEI